MDLGSQNSTPIAPSAFACSTARSGLTNIRLATTTPRLGKTYFRSGDELIVHGTLTADSEVR